MAVIRQKQLHPNGKFLDFRQHKTHFWSESRQSSIGYALRDEGQADGDSGHKIGNPLLGIVEGQPL